MISGFVGELILLETTQNQDRGTNHDKRKGPRYKISGRTPGEINSSGSS